MLFSYTGYLWGFILAAIAIEELQELKTQLQKIRKSLAFITAAVILYIGIIEFTSQLIVAIFLIICAISIITIKQWSNSSK